MDEATRNAYLVKIAFDVITKNAGEPYVTKKVPVVVLPTKPKQFEI